jgi:UDP-N-acetylglucosamine 2-epimerase (non-hydrolysing)
VTSTLAGALAASKLGIPVVHVESGLRSRDWTMPEEINRVLTDRIADLLLTPSPDGNENLRREGIEPERIHLVGNVMIDSLVASLEPARKLSTLKDLGLAPGEYAVCTLHRPSNVDDPRVLGGLLDAITHVAQSLPVVFPVHPRTRKMMAEGGLDAKLKAAPKLKLVEPLGYLEFLALTSQAKLILTDSGGLQEESTALGVSCLTLRENTERPVTVTVGTNQLVGTDPATIKAAAQKVLSGEAKPGKIPELWDGHTAERIAALYEKTLLG